jgi:UMF1 family MFS transporter
MSSLLDRVGLSRPELRAWAMYDFANSAVWSTTITAIFPPFFAQHAAQGLPGNEAEVRFGIATTVAVTAIAVLGPILGAVADTRGVRKRLLAGFVVFGAVAALLMPTIEEGGWAYAAALFIAVNVGVATSLVFYDSLLPHIARPDELDRVSTAGFAIGFFGGGLLLVANLALILSPATFGLSGGTAAVKLSLASVGVWWLLFTVPLLLRVPEPPPDPSFKRSRYTVVAEVFVRLWRTFNELRAHRQAFLFLIAFLLYNDGIQTIIRMATIYGTRLGIDQNAQIAAFVMVQFVGVPASFAFGQVAERIGAKIALFGALIIYTGISLLGYFMASEWHFFALAFLVALVQGGSQALSRSLFARMIPKQKSSEYFGFYSVFEKFGGILGPAMFTFVTAMWSSRMAVLSVILFFVLGALVLTRVNVAEGEAQAASAVA